MTMPSSAKPAGMIDMSGALSGMDLIVASVALLTAVNGRPPEDGEIAEALADENMPNGPADVHRVRKQVALMSTPTPDVADTDTDDWGEPMDTLPPEIVSKLGLSSSD